MATSKTKYPDVPGAIYLSCARRQLNLFVVNSSGNGDLGTYVAIYTHNYRIYEAE